MSGAATLTRQSGIARASWVLGPDLRRPQALQFRVVGGDSIVLYALAKLPADVAVEGDTSLLFVDTIGAPLGSQPTLRVLLPDGLPVVGAQVKFRVTGGGGTLSPDAATTDSSGSVAVSWQLGDSVGVQSMTAEVPASDGGILATYAFRAVSLPGRPASFQLSLDTLRMEALFDTLTPDVSVHDRVGNLVDAGVDWVSGSPDVARGLGMEGIVAVSNGVAQVTAVSGPLRLTIPLVVAQVPAAVRRRVDAPVLNWIGATARLDADVVDARGWPIAGMAPTWSGLDDSVVTVDSTGVIRAIAVGAVRVVARYNGFADTTLVEVRQVPAAITVSPGLDTLELDGTTSPNITVTDSGGTMIPVPAVQLTVSDTSVLRAESDGSLRALLPGTATVTFSAGPVTTSVRSVVDGVAILWGGQRVRSLGVLAGRPPFQITNGRVRIWWSEDLWERGSVAMDVRLGDQWQPATSLYGDWLYITSSVITEPTQIELVELSPDRIALRLRYDDHWFLPQSAGYDSTFVAQPYPFVRTLWLRRGDNGYYSWVDIFDDLRSNLVEHETGFGGIWGPATIRTGQLTLRTDTLQQTTTYNGNPGWAEMGAAVDAAEFVLDGDPVRRLLVPLPEAPFISPVFPGWGFGSVYRYAPKSQSFGVYMFATGVGSGPPAPVVCRAAWENAPFPLRAVSDAEFGSCGPGGP